MSSSARALSMTVPRRAAFRVVAICEHQDHPASFDAFQLFETWSTASHSRCCCQVEFLTSPMIVGFLVK